ncbi:SMI1/KNR4 family protein [Lentzea sp.]|uniref:SMI1/KNR4 family protein n=1 Tax=Lentzea sp. TaxID=56099 RepID=UPI002C903017|nr:SMI1/KNR4 family protein [Lentzea sp.]HUQ57681.1 SMI1/KNR4 family protein [Lentzea sp.]
MKITDDREFPAALTALSGITFPWEFDEEADEAGAANMDYEPYQEFDSAEETTGWIRAWTGNQDLDGDAFRVFGQDGTGGLAALWLVREGPLTAQPVVFFGSEGEAGPVATSLGEFLWLLAGGVGPQEAVEIGADSGVPQEELRAVAEKYSGVGPRTPAEVLAAARAEFPDFAETVQSWCR